MSDPLAAFTPAELRKLRSFKDPYGIQRFLNDTPYHLQDTAWSPRLVLRERTSHCLEGAIFAAAALRALEFPPLVIDFEAEHDTDHVLAVYRIKGHWGALAKSNYTGCRYREPVYRTLRELAMSYFDIYFNMRREPTSLHPAHLFPASKPWALRPTRLDDHRKARLVHPLPPCGHSSHQATAAGHETPPAPRRRQALPSRNDGKSTQALEATKL